MLSLKLVKKAMVYYRYDTTIKIPYNLPEGVYILQYMSAMSAHKTFYYSCARLKVSKSFLP